MEQNAGLGRWQIKLADRKSEKRMDKKNYKEKILVYIGENMPKISILIPIYNVEKYLQDCLESVIHQTERDIEIIVWMMRQ